jgi:hypothetical protein
MPPYVVIEDQRNLLNRKLMRNSRLRRYGGQDDFVQSIELSEMSRRREAST